MQKNVLIVEDNIFISDDMASIVRHALVADPKVATSCAEALEFMKGDIAFALLDLNVTDGKTHDIARLLRSRKIPVLFLSGDEQQSIPDDLMSIGFVKKPAHKLRLIDKIKSLTADFDMSY
jgi:DNA-binding response OmpR family regulator